MEQDEKVKTAVGLSAIFGVAVVDKRQYDKINKEKEKLLKQVKDIDDLRIKMMKMSCKLQAFVDYHAKWKPHTRHIESRIDMLYKKDYVADFEQYPEHIEAHLKEAYNCYAQSLWLSCYGMILRVVEGIISEAYERRNCDTQTNTFQKLEWLKEKKHLKGIDYTNAKFMLETQKNHAHEILAPTELQIFLGFETIKKLLKTIKN